MKPLDGARFVVTSGRYPLMGELEKLVAEAGGQFDDLVAQGLDARSETDALKIMLMKRPTHVVHEVGLWSTASAETLAGLNAAVACRLAGARFVAVGTAAAYAGADGGQESSGLAPAAISKASPSAAKDPEAYASKVLAEIVTSYPGETWGRMLVAPPPYSRRCPDSLPVLYLALAQVNALNPAAGRRIPGAPEVPVQLLHASDLARAVLMAALSESAPQLVHVGPPAVRLKTLFDAAAKVVGYTGAPPWSHGVPPDDGALRTFPPILADTAQEALSWKPQVSLEEGLLEIFRWMELEAKGQEISR